MRKNNYRNHNGLRRDVQSPIPNEKTKRRADASKKTFRNVLKNIQKQIALDSFIMSVIVLQQTIRIPRISATSALPQHGIHIKRNGQENKNKQLLEHVTAANRECASVIQARSWSKASTKTRSQPYPPSRGSPRTHSATGFWST